MWKVELQVDSNLPSLNGYNCAFSSFEHMALNSYPSYPSYPFWNSVETLKESIRFLFHLSNSLFSIGYIFVRAMVHKIIDCQRQDIFRRTLLQVLF